jgi:NAD(P)-dependent dehydrogenase (short-subunit alcohol dehydrogenase family)
VSEKTRLELGPIRYSTSKLANVLQARGLQVVLRDAGRDVDVFAVDPGLMVDTRLARQMPWPMRIFLKSVGYMITPFVDNMRLSTTTAACIETLLLDDDWSGRGFTYLDGLEARDPSLDARRDDLRDELWSESLRLLGINDQELVWCA